MPVLLSDVLSEMVYTGSIVDMSGERTGQSIMKFCEKWHKDQSTLMLSF